MKMTMKAILTVMLIAASNTEDLPHVSAQFIANTVSNLRNTLSKEEQFLKMKKQDTEVG